MELTYYIYQMKSSACQHKCYIGVTNNPRKRLKSHLNAEKLKWRQLTNFGRAIKRYGAKTFTMKIVAQTECIEEASLLETKWIQNLGHKRTWNHARFGGSYTANQNRKSYETGRKNRKEIRKKS